MCVSDILKPRLEAKPHQQNKQTGKKANDTEYCSHHVMESSVAAMFLICLFNMGAICSSQNIWKNNQVYEYF